ncbi:kinase-like domain-containing protein [Crucibulum laeve]|uniref:Kinase-like domain-containing protein n=1 Tax=Crucibulum laeve TaxID=68775 RepID=A0A5C3LLY6_9AGAR|nr:kinase-like domain-containing protein [Crucibulum laeve]
MVERKGHRHSWHHLGRRMHSRISSCSSVNSDATASEQEISLEAGLDDLSFSRLSVPESTRYTPSSPPLRASDTMHTSPKSGSRFEFKTSPRGSSRSIPHDLPSMSEGVMETPPRDTLSLSHSLDLKPSPRPWRERRGWIVPQEQEEGWTRTRSRVLKALRSAIDLTSDAAREALRVGVEVLPFAPVPGLEVAAKILLGIWDAIQVVDSNRLACLRLAERCADILIAIRQEVEEAGINVEIQLKRPLEELEGSFSQILNFLERHNSQPFLMRFVKRDDMLREITECNTHLQHCMDLFDRSILFRIMANVSALTSSSPPLPFQELLLTPDLTSRAVQATTIDPLLDLPIENLPEDLEESSKPTAKEVMSPDGVADADIERNPSLEILSLSDEQVRSILRKLHREQNERDQKRDMSDLRLLLNMALQAGNDRDMMKVLHVGLPDAIKELLRTIDLHIHGDGSQPLTTSAWPLSKPVSRNDIKLNQIIGQGFFSNVYQATWMHGTVAVKVLNNATATMSSFLNEFKIWRSLKHANVTTILGASTVDGSIPKFFITPFMQNGSLSSYLQRMEWNQDESSILDSGDKIDVLRMMHDIAKGMDYLHGHGILHGDLRASNILVDDDENCLVNDFGQSRFEADISYKNPSPHHALRWQAPEVMSGRSLLTAQVDIYAYSISSVEILNMGSIPWPDLHDELVRNHVLDENARPSYPSYRVQSLGIVDILHSCWDASPSKRPTFESLVHDLNRLCGFSGSQTSGSSPSPLIIVHKLQQ